MTNRETGINVVREMMGDQAAANLSASADSNTFGATIAAFPIHSSNFNSASNRSNQRACPVASIPTRTLTCLRSRAR